MLIVPSRTCDQVVPRWNNVNVLSVSPRLYMSAHAQKKNAAARNRTRGRVLLITDEDRSAIGEKLSARDIDVIDVSTGTAALISLQRSRPHLVIVNPSTRGLRVAEFSKML